MNTQVYKSLYVLFVLVFFFTIALTDVSSHEYSGELSLENRYFPSVGTYGNENKSETGLILRPEYFHSWDDDRKVLSFIPYALLNTNDDKKTHFDIREASFVGAYGNLEFRAGISKVFWGVTESQHLVDVINQSDAVINTDGEDKLGQPMLAGTYISSFGEFSFYILPYFRERTFAGSQGRFRGPLLVKNDNTSYEDSREEKHIDFAARYAKTISDLDLALSLFKGTERTPLLIPNLIGSELNPFYIQSVQAGLDLQYIYESWLLKFEGVRNEADLREDYSALTYGLEYTFSNIKSTGLDIGILVEHLYDSRNQGALFDNHSFVGSRVALNDENSTEFLGGIIIDNERFDLSSLRVEASRRINQNWKWELEASAVIDTKAADTLSYIKDDDYLALSFSYYF